MIFVSTVLVALATWRITRLLIVDSFPPFVAFRRKLFAYERTPKWFAYLWTCVWCMSVWVAVPVVVLLAPDQWSWQDKTAAVFAFSGVSGLIGDGE